MSNIDNLAGKKPKVNDTTHTDSILPIVNIGKDAGNNTLPYAVGKSG